jgi:cobyrinic acid a,c-diamide synthase
VSAPGIILAAPASGSGKTTITLALLRAFRRRGRVVGAFKVGPDYIDPRFHGRAAGRPSLNLDSWAMRIETLAGLADRVADGVDLVLGEGVMGLFDGAADGRGSTADLASLFDLPVILVVDARGMAASAAALVEGFTRHRDDVEVAGVLFNRVASAEHEALLRRACDDRFAQPVLACLSLRDGGQIFLSRPYICCVARPASRSSQLPPTEYFHAPEYIPSTGSWRIHGRRCRSKGPGLSAGRKEYTSPRPDGGRPA